MRRDKLDSTYRARAVEKLEELTAQVTALHRDLYFEGRVVDPMVAVKGRVVELRGSGVGTRRLNMWMAAFETNAKIKVRSHTRGKGRMHTFVHPHAQTHAHAHTHARPHAPAM